MLLPIPLPPVRPVRRRVFQRPIRRGAARELFLSGRFTRAQAQTAAGISALGFGLERRFSMVMEQMITVEDVITASNTDFLAGTQLDQPGVPGVYTVWLASTVGDTTVSITLGGRQIVNAAVVVLRANSEVRENEDTFFQMLSRTGGRPVINITEVTAASIRVRVKFIPAFAS